MSGRAAVAVALSLLGGAAVLGCGDIFHATDWSGCEPDPNGDGCLGAGAASQGGAGADGGSPGAGGDGGCTPSDTRSCYSGPADTASVGACRDGTQTCDDSGTWGPCDGEVLPVVEDCSSASDDDCADDGNAGCALPSCADVLASMPDSTDGIYAIDPDGAGPLPPVDTHCDMSTEGGGWTLLAKTVRARLTMDESNILRESFWEDYASLGYGEPSPSSRIYWMPLSHWHALTSATPNNELVSRTGTIDVRVTSFSVASEADNYAWSWAAETPGFPGILASLKGQSFTARDEDNDMLTTGNCAVDNVGLNGGFWYSSCGQLSMLHVDGNVYRLDTNATTAVEYNEIYFR